MKKATFIIVLVLLSSCTQYAVIEGPQTVGAMTVTPSEEWNKVPSLSTIGSVPSWTADGISLNTISFISEVEDGQPLFKAVENKEEYPVFQANMLPTELVDLFESTLAKAYNAKITKSGQLKPLMLDGVPGFEYTFEFVTSDELTRKGYVVGAVKNEQLHMIFYQAARLHYFDERFKNVQHMVKGMTFN